MLETTPYLTQSKNSLIENNQTNQRIKQGYQT
jgi:hypothetical protein